MNDQDIFSPHSIKETSEESKEKYQLEDHSLIQCHKNCMKDSNEN